MFDGLIIRLTATGLAALRGVIVITLRATDWTAKNASAPKDENAAT